jgi:hypothetical protein
MKVLSDNSIYSVFSTANRRPPSIDNEKMVLPSPEQPTAAPAASDSQLVADFQARMARQSLDWADSDKNGKVTEEEYMSGQARLADLNHRPDDKTANEKEWAAIDVTGKGWVDQTELGNGLAKMLPVSVGHFDQGYAERLRNSRA